MLFVQAARDRDADLWREFAELAGGERAQPREHHLTARLGRARAASLASCVPPLRGLLTPGAAAKPPVYHYPLVLL